MLLVQSSQCGTVHWVEHLCTSDKNEGNWVLECQRETRRQLNSLQKIIYAPSMKQWKTQKFYVIVLCQAPCFSVGLRDLLTVVIGCFYRIFQRHPALCAIMCFRNCSTGSKAVHLLPLVHLPNCSWLMGTNLGTQAIVSIGKNRKRKTSQLNQSRPLHRASMLACPLVLQVKIICHLYWPALWCFR